MMIARAERGAVGRGRGGGCCCLSALVLLVVLLWQGELSDGFLSSNGGHQRQWRWQKRHATYPDSVPHRDQTSAAVAGGGSRSSGYITMASVRDTGLSGLGRREQLLLVGGAGAAAPWAIMGLGGRRRQQEAVAAELCDDAISHLRERATGKEIFIVGTAHISNASALLVRETIRRVKPQTVMLELDESRVGRVNSPPSSDKPSSQLLAASSSSSSSSAPQPPPAGTTTRPSQAVPTSNKVGFLQSALKEVTKSGSSFRDKLLGIGALALGKVISGLYSSLDKMGFVSGQEFMVAIEEARLVGANLLLGDRDVKVTLRRLSEALSESDLSKVMTAESPTDSPAVRLLAQKNITIATEDAAQISKAVEALKERQTVRALMATLKTDLPLVYNAMIRERDEYMAGSLSRSPSKRIVAVVGMGHMDGIEATLSAAGYELLRGCAAAP